MLPQLRDTQQAFDSVAADYDGPAGNNPLIQRFRARLRAAVLRAVPPGRTLLDVGCGTGLDAEFFAQQGYHVIAIDWSTAMVARAERRLAQAGLKGRAETRPLGAQELDQLAAGVFDGAYADLGPLNCVPHLAEVADQLARAIRPGGAFVTSVIGRVCPWELIFYAARGRWQRAAVRLKRGCVPVPLNGQTVWTCYYTPHEFESIFAAAGFRRVSLRSLGLLTPPPYLAPFAGRHPHLLGWLQALEDRCASWPILNQWGDHFLLAMRR